MTDQLVKQRPTMDEFLAAMEGKAEDLLRKFFVGKTFDGEPWVQEHFQVTMQVVVDVTVANTDLTDFNINTSIEGHILLMNVTDKEGNTIADVIYLITQSGESYTVDDVKVAFKLGAFVAPKEEAEEEPDELPFD